MHFSSLSSKMQHSGGHWGIWYYWIEKQLRLRSESGNVAWFNAQSDFSLKKCFHDVTTLCLWSSRDSMFIRRIWNLCSYVNVRHNSHGITSPGSGLVSNQWRHSRHSTGAKPPHAAASNHREKKRCVNKCGLPIKTHFGCGAGWERMWIFCPDINLETCLVWRCPTKRIKELIL